MHHTTEACALCGHVQETSHWNDPGKLAPVSTWMYVKIPAGTLVEHPDIADWVTMSKDSVAIAFRTRHLSEREGNMEYQLLNGGKVVSKLWWTHA
jgi:hypothetical protein